MKNLPTLSILADNMRRLRKLKHLTQEELAYRTGLHPYFIGLIERKTKTPSLTSMEKIARALDVSVAELVSEPAMNEKTARDARGEEIVQLMRGLIPKNADAVLEIVKKAVTLAADDGRVKGLKAAEEKKAYVATKKKKKSNFTS